MMLDCLVGQRFEVRVPNESFFQNFEVIAVKGHVATIVGAAHQHCAVSVWSVMRGLYERTLRAPGAFETAAALSGAVMFLNTISDAWGQREAVERAVLDALTGRTGDWSVSLLETRGDDQRWLIMVEGPGEAKRTWTFEAGVQEPSIVRATVERDLAHWALPMGWQATAS